VPLWLEDNPVEIVTTTKQSGRSFTMLGLAVTVFKFAASNLKNLTPHAPFSPVSESIFVHSTQYFRPHRLVTHYHKSFETQVQ
jgi:hypothetical protein